LFSGGDAFEFVRAFESLRARLEPVGGMGLDRKSPGKPPILENPGLGEDVWPCVSNGLCVLPDALPFFPAVAQRVSGENDTPPFARGGWFALNAVTFTDHSPHDRFPLGVGASSSDDDKLCAAIMADTLLPRHERSSSLSSSLSLGEFNSGTTIDALATSSPF